MKHRLTHILAAPALATVLLISSSATALTHVVAQGHTLERIAKRYHVTVEALEQANHLTPGQMLKRGQKLVIPEPPKPAGATSVKLPSKPPKSQVSTGHLMTHRVSEGQTLGRISRRYGTTPEAVLESNGLEPSVKLRIGQCLVIPVARHRGELRPCEPKGSGIGQASAPSKSPKAVSYAAKSDQPGVVHLVRGTESWKGRVVDRQGNPLPEGAKTVNQLLQHRMDPKLLPLLGRLSDHFGGRPIHIVSAYRPPSDEQYTEQSKHNTGQAVDFFVEGVPNSAVKAYCYSFSKVGVGYYPNSTFVHLDVRPVTTHWVDISGPGQPPRYISVTAPQKAASKP